MRRSEECKIRIKVYESWGNKLGEMNKKRFERVLERIESGAYEDMELTKEQEEKIRRWEEQQ